MITAIPSDESYELTVPESPLDLGFDSIPSWWPLQRQTIGRVVSAFNSGYDVVMLNAPPGSGKTLVAAASSKLLGTKSVTFTHTLALQDQYLRTATWAETMKGKSNYECGEQQRSDAAFVRSSLRREVLTTEDCDEYLDCENPWRNGCPYYAALGQAADSNLVVLNYSYGLRIAQSPYLKRGVCLDEDDSPLPNPFLREMAVSDEGHLANDAIVGACALEFWHKTLRKMGLRCPTNNDPVEWQQWAQSLVLTSNYANMDIVTQARMRNHQERLSQLRTINPADWIVQPSDNMTKLQPIWARSVYSNFLGKYLKLLIMSATLGNPDLLQAKLGLDDKSVAYVDVGSTFPVQNRPVFYWPTVKLNAKSEDSDYATLASAIQFIANQPNLATKKGIVHTSSYKVARRLAPYLRQDSRYLIQESSETREALVALFSEEGNNFVIVTPSLSTGFDLPYLIGFQIIAKVPFSDLGDPLVKARREYELPDDNKFGKKTYDDDAQNQVIQACGRAVRAPDDMGVSYILDANWWGLYKRSYSPEYFRESVQWLN